MKKTTKKDLKGHFFLSVDKKTVNVCYDDENLNSLTLGFAQALAADNELFELIANAILIVIKEKEKQSIKTKKCKL
jgi:hypothetical protein